MKIGVTGTRSGMTDLQKENVTEFLYFNRDKHIYQLKEDEIEFHHGDCIGVDIEVANIAVDMNYFIITHPPEKHNMRAYCEYSDDEREPFSYFKRNRNIVDESDILLVVPYQNEWTSHGGTWYTHDYANKKNKDIIIFYPNGKIWEKVRSKLF